MPAHCPPGHGRRMPTIEAGLAPSVSSPPCVREVVLSSALRFFGDSDMKMRWAEVLGLVLLGTGPRDADRATEPGGQGCLFLACCPSSVCPPSPVSVLCVGLDDQTQPATGNGRTLSNQTQPLISRSFSSETEKCGDDVEHGQRGVLR